MKKKYLIILFIIIVVLLVIGIMIFAKKDNNISTSYMVKINLVDEKSPDRTLTVYDSDKEIEYREIRYIDNILLCKSYNPTVYYGDVETENELKIILNDGTEVIAKVVKGE